jgi:hypothetical protein
VLGGPLRFPSQPTRSGRRLQHGGQRRKARHAGEHGSKPPPVDSLRAVQTSGTTITILPLPLELTMMMTNDGHRRPSLSRDDDASSLACRSPVQRSPRNPLVVCVVGGQSVSQSFGRPDARSPPTTTRTQIAPIDDYFLNVRSTAGMRRQVLDPPRVRSSGEFRELAAKWAVARFRVGPRPPAAAPQGT